MRRKIERLLLVAVGITFIFILNSLNIFATISPTKDFYVNDFANVLNKETKSYILNNSVALYDKTKAQVVVATVDSLEGKDVTDYSLELFRNWGIGEKNLNNGLLILLSVGDRQVRIEVGDGLEGQINDSKAGRFLDEYGIPFFKNDEWDTGIKTLYSSLISEVYTEYDIEMPEEVSAVVENFDEISEDSKVSMLMGFVLIALILVFGGILPFIFRKKYHSIYDDDTPYTHNTPTFFGGFGGSSGSGGGFSGGGGSASGGGASRGF